MSKEKKEKNKEPKDELLEEIYDNLNKEKPEQILILENKVEELENKIKLTQADNINFRRRKQEEVATMLKFANQELILDILPIEDNFEIVLKEEIKDPNLKAYVEGFKMIYSNLMTVLEKHGVKKIEATNKKFDPALHDAIMIGEDKTKQDEEILNVFKEGYTLHDKVIRHSQVQVNKLK